MTQIKIMLRTKIMTIVTAGLMLISAYSFGAVNPMYKHNQYFFDVLTFAQNHPVMLDGMKRINSTSYEELHVIYDYQKSDGEVQSCTAVFKRSALSYFIFFSNKVVFSQSDCPID